MTRAVTAGACLFLATTLASSAYAADTAMAESLFREGRRSMEAGDYAAACPKLAESQRLDPGGGTLLALALCHEKQGAKATAWAEYTEALADARREGRADRQRVARAAIDRLAPTIPRLRIVIAGDMASLRHLVVQRDGVALGAAVYGLPIAVDPGTHLIEAAAEDRLPFRRTIVVPDQTVVETISIDLPPNPSHTPVVVAGAPPPATHGRAQDARAAPAPSSGASTLGWISLGIGAASLLVGGFFGVRAISQWSDAKSACDPSRCTDPEGPRAEARAQAAATLADVLVPVGLVGVGVGGVLLVTSGTNKASASLSARLSISARVAGLVVGGGF